MELILFPFIVLFPLTIVFLGTIFWIWMIVDCAVNEPANDNNKIVWVIIIVFTHFLGSVIYFLVRRPQRLREVGR